MLQDSSDKQDNAIKVPLRSQRFKWLMIIALPAWVFISLMTAQFLVGGLLWLLHSLGVSTSSINENVFTATLAALIYMMTLALVIGLPWLVRKVRTGRKDIGLDRLPSWTDIWMTPVGLIVYFILSAVLILTATSLFPWFDAGQSQDTGFRLTERYEYVLAFITLVVIAPVAEEILFRGYLFGRLRKYVPVWAAVLATSLLFGLIHVVFTQNAWNLAADTFALSIVLCLLRLSTRSLWAPILLHMAKNGIAFYILFINPLLNGIVSG